MAIAVFLILLLLILFTPIKYKLNFAYHEQLSFQAAISYGLACSASMDKQDGKLKTRLRIIGMTISVPTGKKTKQNTKHESKSGSSGSLTLLRSFFNNKTYRPVWRLISRIFKRVKPDYIIAEGRYGFYEPHYTAWLNVLLAMVPMRPPRYTLQLEPVWDDELLDVEGFVEGSVSIAGIILSLLILLVNPSTFRFLREIRKVNKANKNHRRIILQPSS